MLDGGLGDKWFIIGGGKSEPKYAIVHRATATTPSKTLKKMKLINKESLMTDFYLHRSFKDVVFWKRFNGLLEEHQPNPCHHTDHQMNGTYVSDYICAISKNPSSDF